LFTGWEDNYLCLDRDIGMQMSEAGEIANLTCTNIDSSDGHPGGWPVLGWAWNDNFICLPENSVYKLTWTSEGVTAGHSQCVAFTEPADDQGWNDNYLCFDAK
jgi:hypothetical protein